MMKYLLQILLIFLVAPGVTSCIEDGFDTSASAQPTFSVDTLDMGTQFTDLPSITASLVIHNPHSKQLNLSSVRMRQGDNFRINVDGMSGSEFTNVEIRPQDSIYVFVECTFAETAAIDPVRMTDYLDVVTNGVTRSLPVVATAQNAVRHAAETITEDVTFGAQLPHLVSDTLRVSPGATLTLEPGATLLFHDKAALIVEGTLIADATAEQPVTLRGDRTGNVVSDISYDVMSNQWEGIRFASESKGNRLSHTSVVNTCQGVALDSLAELTLINCCITNSGGVLLQADNADITAVGTELSNAADALALLNGGTHLFDRCTLANFYLFKWPGMAIIELPAPEVTHANFTNCIIYGRDTPISDYADTNTQDIWFQRCLFKVNGTDDDRYLSCIWDTDPLLEYSLTEYTFSYIPEEGSPALNAAYSGLDSELLPAADRHGRLRANTLGAYAPLD
jgi:hypothetical protein